MTIDHMDPESSSSPDDKQSTDFKVSVHIVNLERDSLSRRLEKVNCSLACDDTASVNLYLDQRQELDFIQFKLTHGIRQLYINAKTCTVKVQLSTQQRLDITLHSQDQCQALYDKLFHIKTRPNDTDCFPKHQPKTGIVKPDPTLAYLTANDTPSDLMFNPFYVDTTTTSSTPSKRRAIVQRSTAALEQTHKKTRTQHTDSKSELLRQSRDSLCHTTPSSSATATATLDNSLDQWNQVEIPVHNEDELMTTPKKLTLDIQATKGSDRPSPISTLSPFSSMKPQFHSAIPSPRVLRPMNERIRRYGREGGIRKLKRMSPHERANGTRCVAAVLRALFWLDPVARDLRESSWQFNRGQPGLFKSIVDSFSPHSKRHRAEIKEEAVSENVIKSSKGRLGDEDDAREFLNDTINQVRREFRERNVNSTCPLSRLFECNIDNTLVCMDCGNAIVQTEHCQDFCLELPAVDNNRSSQRAVSIGSLFPQMFDTRQVAYECEACQSESAMVHRSISKLPDVLVVYLKRFTLRPTFGYNKDRSRVAIDGTLEFSQFCSPAAFSQIDSEDTKLLDSEEDHLYSRPHIPSDSPSSSGSLWFSSISPTESDEVFDSSTPSRKGSDDYIDVDLYGTLDQGTASNPFLLNSDEEGSYEVSGSQSFSFYEQPSEDEQYEWAMEESLRASQTFSQESIKDGGYNEDNHQGHLNDSKPKKGVSNNNNRLAEKSHAKDDHVNVNSDWQESDLFSGISGDSMTTVGGKKKSDDKDDKGDDDDDEDEEIKAAILASLIPENTQVDDEKELQDREKRELEEAIRRSLLDSEENKENISPEKFVGKKGHKGKRPSLTRSCSQMQMKPLECGDRVPPRLLRANTIDVIAKSQSSVDSLYLSQQQSQEESTASATVHDRDNGSKKDFISNATTTENPGNQKGKDKKIVQTETQDRSMGLFQLKAMVSHTGLISSTSEGHYVCDGLGADGLWRCYDEGKHTKIGSISDLSQHRGRTGYLFFYVHCYSAEEAK